MIARRAGAQGDAARGDGARVILRDKPFCSGTPKAGAAGYAATSTGRTHAKTKTKLGRDLHHRTSGENTSKVPFTLLKAAHVRPRGDGRLQPDDGNTGHAALQARCSAMVAEALGDLPAAIDFNWRPQPGSGSTARSNAWAARRR